MEPDVVRRHIELYVNEYTYDLGEGGAAAVDVLLSRAAAAGLVPAAAL
jgi:1,4-dihydroxy-6-naphthoate synthase